jgi:adenylate cyclase
MDTVRVERRLAAILAIDVAGYSRLMGSDELGTLAGLRAVRQDRVDPAIAAHNGRIVKTTGDGMLVEFASAVDAVNCAMVMQDQMVEPQALWRSNFASVSTSEISLSKAVIFLEMV